MPQQKPVTRNLYAIQGVSSSANTHEDKKAYRRLTLQLHSDKQEGAAI